MLLTIVTMIYVTPPELIYLITGGLYLLTTCTHFSPLPQLWQPPICFLFLWVWFFKIPCIGTSLVAQWLRIHLPMQGTRVPALVREDPTCRGATKPVRHNYRACALEPASHNYWAHVPRLLKPVCLEPVLHNKRSHRNEKPAHCSEDPMQPKINKLKKKRFHV